MAVYPTHTFNEQEIKFRYGERVQSQAVNRKFLGVPPGVYFGFTASFVNDVLTLAPQSGVGWSWGRLISSDDALYSVDVVLDSNLTFDFAGHTTWPVNVVLKAYGTLGQPHTAEILTQVAATDKITEILLCVVCWTLPHGGITPSAIGTFQQGEAISAAPSGATGTVIGLGNGFLGVDITGGTFAVGDTVTGGASGATATLTGAAALGVVEDPPGNRDTPYAWSSAPMGYGFMPSNSVEELIDAVSLVAEVAAARVDLTGFTHLNLSARLQADMLGASMADRLGKEVYTIISDTHVVTAPSTTLNVSRSFSAFHRNLLGLTPVENIQGFGSETRPGAITSGTIYISGVGKLSDSERNVCPVVNSTDNSRVVSSDQDVVYGRMSFAEIELTGTLSFSVGVPNVSGVGTAFLSEVQIGDIIQDHLDNYYEVQFVTDNFNLILSVNAAATGGGANLRRRRYTLNFLYRTSLTNESAYQVPASSIKFYFPTWRSLELGQFDYLPFLARHFEEPAVPLATTSLDGKAYIAPNAVGGLVGAILSVEDTGVPVGSGQFHTIDFEGATNAGGGVVNVTQRGPTGNQGPPGGGGGGVGPDGPPGPQGIGFTNSTPFVKSGAYVHPSWGSGAAYSYLYDFGFSNGALFVTGGVAAWNVPGGVFMDGDDHFEITDIQRVQTIPGGPLSGGQLFARVPLGLSPTATMKYFLNAAGY